MKKIITTIYGGSLHADDFSAKEKELFKQAEKAAEKAYAPYSNFKVGAAVLLENGKIISGNNQENAAYPSGLCAERVALFYANAQYPDVAVSGIAVIAITPKGNILESVPPCGSCRQVLLETENRFQNKMKVFMVGRKSVHFVDSASELLPLSFDKDMLNK